MKLKIYVFQNPVTGKFEEVYEYPVSFAPKGYIEKSGCIAVTRKVMQFPILSILSEYLTELGNHRIVVDFEIFQSFEYSKLKKDV